MGDNLTDEIIAFLDVGTNSIRLLIVRLNPNNSYTVLTQQKELVRLGEGEFNRHCLSKEAIERAILVVKKFTELAENFGVTRIISVATSATREAKNRSAFLKRLEKETGYEMKVVSGKEEARLIYLGVAGGMVIGNQKTLFIDIGGGSTELIVGTQTRYTLLESYKLGSIRLTELFFPKGTKEPILEDDYENLCQHIRDTLVQTSARIAHEAPVRVVGSSGTIENLSQIADRLFHDGVREQPYPVLTRDDLGKVVGELCSRTSGERKKIPGLNPDRADIIIAGAAILETIMYEFGIDAIQVSDRSLKDGLLVDYLRRRGGFPQTEEMSVRKQSVIQLGRSCHSNEDHALKVAELSLRLFDSGKQIGLHRMGDLERELLEYAAYLHDTGQFLSFSNHHHHSAYIISHAELLGFDEEEISLISLIASFHRKKISYKPDSISGAMDTETQQKIFLLSAFLRIAESLDRSHAGLVDAADFVEMNDTTATLAIHSRSDCMLEKWAVESDSKTLKKLLDRKLILT